MRVPRRGGWTPRRAWPGWWPIGWADVVLWSVLCGWAVLWGLHRGTPAGLSWHFFPYGSHLLLHGTGLRLYAENPGLQIGPLAFLAAAAVTSLAHGADRVVAEVLMAAVGPLLLAVIASMVPASRRRSRVLLGGLVLIPAWTVLAVQWGHLDDVLALAGCVLALRAARSDRPVLTGLVLAVAVAAKPWALGVAPVLLLLERRRIWAAAVAAGGIVLAWAPFLLASPATLNALHPPVGMAPSSGLRILGVRAEVVPGWGRTVQLVIVPTVAAVALLRRRWPGLLLLAVAARLAADPQDNAYYLGGTVLAAVLFDLVGTGWLVPWTALVASVAFWQPFILDYAHPLAVSHGFVLWWLTHPTVIGWVHLAWVAGVVALVLLAPDAVLAGRRPGWRTTSRPAATSTGVPSETQAAVNRSRIQSQSRPSASRV